MKNKFIMLISGTAGVGKNTLINGIVGSGKAKFISSYTTRERRETDNKDQYQYISKQEFEDKLKTGEIFEYDMFNSKYYGTAKSLFTNALSENAVVIKDISVLGVTNCREALESEFSIISVFLTENKSVLKQRLIERGETKERIKNRLKLYKKEQAARFKFDFIIKNSNYNKSQEELDAIINYGTGVDIIYPYKNYTKLSAKKIDKFAFKLERGKQIKPIKVAIINNKIYIVDGVHRYLAGLKAGKIVAKQFVDCKTTKFDFNLDEWKKIVSSFDVKNLQKTKGHKVWSFVFL